MITANCKGRFDNNKISHKTAILRRKRIICRTNRKNSAEKEENNIAIINQVR